MNTIVFKHLLIVNCFQPLIIFAKYYILDVLIEFWIRLFWATFMWLTMYTRENGSSDKCSKWLSCVASTYLYGAFDCMFLSCHVRVRGLILKHVRNMIRTYSQMYCTDKYSQHSSTIWPVWINCGFESRCCHLNFKYRVCFEQGVPWHSGNYRVWIHYETCTWHDKNIQSNTTYR